MTNQEYIAAMQPKVSQAEWNTKMQELETMHQENMRLCEQIIKKQEEATNNLKQARLYLELLD